MVNRKSKQVTWSSKKLTSVQHDPTVTRSGNILIFNNRSHMSKSQVLMINPKNNELVWKYPVGEPKITDFQFSAGIVSGVQELDNGNILISNGVLGYISEVTKEGTRVWDLFSIPSQDSSTPWPYKGFFKVRQYSQKYFKAKIQSKIVKISKLCI